MNQALEEVERQKRRYLTKPIELAVEFAATEQVIQTLEGPVQCIPGDAILTGVAGERWPVPRAKFDLKYAPVGGQAAGLPGRYAKQPTTVEAAQLSQPMAVPLSGDRGVLEGNVGDWVVWYAPDDAAIVAQDIFPILYEQA